MKKLLLIPLALIILCPVAQAGVMSAVQDWVFDNAIGVILTAVFTLVAGFFGGTAWGKAILKAKLPITELKDVMVKVHEARRPTSAGGKRITNEEKDAILKEVEELIQSVVTAFGKGK